MDGWPVGGMDREESQLSMQLEDNRQTKCATPSHSGRTRLWNNFPLLY